VRTMTAQNVAKLMEKMADTPSAATNLLKRLRQLFDYSILIGMRRDNPAKAVRVRSDLSNLKSDDLSNLSETNVKQG